ncbi:MAG: hypothetical protein BIFFINMI_02906 [Phycisphaerae bacterium]|nr:hypothetical protein [Phycisphaerae bacterium]
MKRATLCVAVVALSLAFPLAAPAGDLPREFVLHHDNVIGTSLDLTVLAADDKQAADCEKRVLDEIERLRKILSTWDAASEISRLNATAEPMACSDELLDVLEAGERWRTRSGGAFSIQLGDLIARWKQAQKENKPPSAEELAALADQVQGPACRIDRKARTATRVTKARLNIDGLAKGYIIDKAMAAARAAQPAPGGIMINLGGDILVWGRSSPTSLLWPIAVADPSHSEDNAPPLTELRLGGRAIATSGDYARFYNIEGKRHSHILDPLTGESADRIISASVVAPDAMTADVLATALCVLEPDESLKLLRAMPGVEALIIAADNKQFHTPGWEALETPEARKSHQAAESAGGNWPAGFKVDIALTLVSLNSGRREHRPYLAVWIEDDRGKPVRTIALWGREAKYLRDLSTWYRYARNDPDMIRRVSRASRSAGNYTLVWDGADDAGKPLPRGQYTVRMEINREKGRHISNMSAAINCADKPAAATIPGNSDVANVKIQYGP